MMGGSNRAPGAPKEEMEVKIRPRKIGGVQSVAMTMTKAVARGTCGLPDARIAKVSDARPSVTLIGKSGSGKTYAIGRMLDAGYKGLILAVEDKIQSIAKYNPPTVFINDPVVDAEGNKRYPTDTEKYERLMAFPTALREGKLREFDGKPIDFIAIDGFLEVGQVIFTYNKKCKPISKSGEQNTYALWDKVAEDAVDFFKACRDAAGMASAAYGFPPVGFVATCGEHMEVTKLKEVRYTPLFPGRKAPELLPYMFEHVIRLANRVDEGEYVYVAHTVGDGEFDAKTPSGLFEAEEINPDFGVMWKKLLDHLNEEKKV